MQISSRTVSYENKTLTYNFTNGDILTIALTLTNGVDNPTAEEQAEFSTRSGVLTSYLFDAINKDAQGISNVTKLL